jgi:signal transduction histidine kinase/ABC-type amino acid transport substrate-binding protein
MSNVKITRFLLMFLLLMQLDVRAFAVELTLTEQSHLQQLGTVNFCVDPDWSPFEVIDDKGQHVGIAADLLALVAQRTGLPLRLFKSKDWPESLQASKSGRCQLMSLLNQTRARDAWLIFTQPILTDDNILITREEHPFVVDLASLQGQTMVLPKGTSIEERVRRDFSNLKLIVTDTEAQALQMVSDRQADMTMRSLIVAAYTIKREGWFNLKIAGQVPGYGNQLRIGVQKGDTVLRDILDKGVASITPVERQQIIDRHITINMTTGIDYALVKQLVAVLALVLLTSLFWVKKLNRLNAELKKSEISLKESQKIAGLGSYVIDLPTLNWTSSEVFDELFGISPSYPRSRTGWVDRIHPAHQSSVLDAFNHAVAARQAQTFDAIYRIIRHNDQSERWIHGLGKLEFDAQGHPLRMIGTIQDITERKQAELQLNQAKDMAEQTATQQRQFIAMLSHEVRTPLAVIDATAQVLMLRLNAETDKHPLVNRIRRGAARLAYFFDNCLTADRIDSQNFSVQPSPVAVGQLVTSVTENAALQSPDHRIELDIEPGLPALQGDQVLLRIMLMNLLSNALKYSPESTPVLLRVWRKTDEVALCCFAVKDQGPGIPADEIDLIFQKYQRGRSAEGKPGAGLGLSVVTRIAKLHGGSVTVASQQGRSTQFTVEIPF